MPLRKLWSKAHNTKNHIVQRLHKRSPHPYQSQPLPDDGQAWVRILQLSPSESRGAPLQGYLLPRRLDEVSYEALSYAWSDDSSSVQHQQAEHTISLLVLMSGDGESSTMTFEVHEPPISRNLHTALLYLRDKKDSRYLWIDAVCINQNDLEEKQKQIRIMGRIYSQAEQTIIWLGEADEDTEHVFEFVRSIGPTMANSLTMIRSRELHQLLDREGVTTEIWNSVYTLCNRAWFYRAWTAQELCLSPRPKVMCGVHCLEWQDLEFLLLNMSRDHAPSKHTYIAKNRNPVPRAELYGSLQLSTTGNRRALHLLFTGMGGLKAADPKDIVLGMLALLEQRGLDLPPISYKMSIAEIFAIATRSWVRFNGRLKCLNWAVTRSSTPNIPSWTIDWEHVGTKSGLWNLEETSCEAKQENTGYPIFAARGVDLQEVLGKGKDWRRLRLRGILLGQHVSGHFQSEHSAGHWDGESSFLEPPLRWALFVGNFMDSRRLHAKNTSSTFNDFVRLLSFLQMLDGIIVPTRPGSESQDLTKLKTLLEQTAAVTKGFLGERRCVSQGTLPPELFQTLGARGLLFGVEAVHDQGSSVYQGLTHFETDMLSCATLRNYTLFGTSHGEIGVCCNKEMKDGDVIALLAGSDYPVVLRRTDMEGEYQFVGQAYMDRLMDGHAWPENEEDLEMITLR